MSFSVAIIGRPNVGKSTLFNRLAGKKLALVDDTPGVTRDWRAAPATLAGLEFTIIDTAGLEEAFDASLEARMRRQTEQALAQADVALLLIDARAGVTPMDRHFANWLRAQPIPVILVANKAEGRAGEGGLYEAFELGLGEPVAISAEHGEGMGELFDALLPFAKAVDEEEPEELHEQPYDAAEDVLADAREAAEEAEKALQLAIVGRPNVGKSTLMNALLGEERVLTGPEAGMTRDAISAEWEYQGRRIRLIDTAGLRRRANVVDKLEKLSVADALRAVRLAHVVALVVDADMALDKQDLTIARLVVEEGRALILAVNKWDKVEDKGATMRAIRDKLGISLPQVKGLAVVPISALKGQKLDALLDAALEAYDVWNRRVSTAQLNRWLGAMTEAHPPPLVDGRRLKLRYMTQVKARPPTFALWVSRPVELPDSYARYLANGLREAFDMPGTPIRLMLRKSKNPYANEKN